MGRDAGIPAIAAIAVDTVDEELIIGGANLPGGWIVFAQAPPAGSVILGIDEDNVTSLGVNGGAAPNIRLQVEGNLVALELDSAGLTISGLPAADPHVANRLWSNAGVLTVSAG